MVKRFGLDKKRVMPSLWANILLISESVFQCAGYVYVMSFYKTGTVMVCDLPLAQIAV